MSRPSSDQVFVIRTWLELPGDTRTMRGRIDHVASGRRRYFANFGDLCDFIAELQPAGPPQATVDTRDGAEEPP